MSLPTKTKTWTISANNRISFVSLVQVMREYLFGIKGFLKTHGYTVNGSSNGTTGGTAGTPDGVDRWVAATDAGTRGTAAATVQSWVLLTDGNGVQILLAFQGATDNIARISMSPGALYVVPATTTNQPTATDEVVINTAQDLVEVTASGDRVWFGWVDSTSKLCRFTVFRNNVINTAWGVELTSSVVSGSVVVWTPPVVGFNWFNGTNNLGTGTAPVKLRAVVSSTGTVLTGRLGCEQLANVFAASNTGFMLVNCELQGSKGYPALSLSFAANDAGATGKYGDFFDQWVSQGSIYGDLYGTTANQFISLSVVGPAGVRIVWPWDGTTIPITT